MLRPGKQFVCIASLTYRRRQFAAPLHSDPLAGIFTLFHDCVEAILNAFLNIQFSSILTSFLLFVKKYFFPHAPFTLPLVTVRQAYFISLNEYCNPTYAKRSPSKPFCHASVMQKMYSPGSNGIPEISSGSSKLSDISAHSPLFSP